MKDFSSTGLTRSDITFAADQSYAILRLKRSKTDVNNNGVDIVLAATNKATCPVRSLQRLWRLDPQPQHAPLFRRTGGVAFTYESLLTDLRQQVRAIGVTNWHDFSGHSYRRGAATQAHLNGLPYEEIQRLGRWTSNAFIGYITTSIFSKFILSQRFLTGFAPSLHINTPHHMAYSSSLAVRA
jgi:hypothetical protein